MLKQMVDGYVRFLMPAFGGGGSSAPAQQTVTNNTAPWAGQQPYLSDVFAQAQALNNAPGPSYFPGKVTAAPDALTGQAQQAVLNANPAVQGLGETAAATNTFNMTDARDVNSNPYLRSAIDAAIRPLTEQFTESGGALQQTREGAQLSGQYGSSRQGIAEGLANKAYINKVGDVASTMASHGYDTGLDASVKATALNPQVQQGLLAPASNLDAVGQQRNAYEQAAIDDAINKWNYEQNLTGAKLAQYQNLVQGNFGGQSSGLSTATGGSRGGSNNMLGILGGAAAGASLAGALGMSAGAGAGIGALFALI